MCIVNNKISIWQSVWVHIAFTLKGSIGSVIVNGVHVVSGVLKVPAKVNRTNNFFGKGFNITDAYLDAYLDSIKFHQTAFTPDEVLNEFFYSSNSNQRLYYLSNSYYTSKF